MKNILEKPGANGRTHTVTIGLKRGIIRMQRLYANFACGRPGSGLLWLHLVAAVRAPQYVFTGLTSEQHFFKPASGGAAARLGLADHAT